MQVLAEQRKLDELGQRRLELVADVLALVRADGWKVCALLG
jgi:hypothetical protein